MQRCNLGTLLSAAQLQLLLFQSQQPRRPTSPWTSSQRVSVKRLLLWPAQPVALDELLSDCGAAEDAQTINITAPQLPGHRLPPCRRLSPVSPPPLPLHTACNPTLPAGQLSLPTPRNSNLLPAQQPCLRRSLAGGTPSSPRLRSSRRPTRWAAAWSTTPTRAPCLPSLTRCARRRTTKWWRRWVERACLTGCVGVALAAAACAA